ncbi:hypothetical protein BEL04_05320 [Mucilaginibacter sp. PPCGB 2223]|uniref:MNIO family bufferin maturase n=1 Tax=Mucilaginibacter sp. PPCGB 2223 TaxID=1886027 RepID=UPI000824EFBC|nr:DUF692 domain-containing protein [Mucilaginibacter sp. PPCGB 2223]OCX53715.1 hypothetical protein BEL04_05320 [Mucilaginibacter sp. PPCGB 2223]
MDKTKTQRLGLPNLGLGVGLRSKHYSHLMHNDPVIDWFEIISENYINNFGYSRRVLEHVAGMRPIVMHGVSMSIGSTDPLNLTYLQQLKDLANFVNPVWISDHLCWTGVAHVNTHDLLPMPLTLESLEHVTERVNRVQDVLQRPLILENPSTYMEFHSSVLHEWEFMTELVNKTGCGLLLDVNNVFVSGSNHGFDPEFYIRNIPHHAVVQIHIAGPTDCEDYILDTHDQSVPTPVWKLYRLAQELTGGVSTLLEWDANIPEYDELVAEVGKARQVLLGDYPDVPVYRSPYLNAVSNPVDHQLQITNG